LASLSNRPKSQPAANGANAAATSPGSANRVAGSLAIIFWMIATNLGERSGRNSPMERGVPWTWAIILVTSFLYSGPTNGACPDSSLYSVQPSE
jgi:hypothetical protein